MNKKIIEIEKFYAKKDEIGFYFNNEKISILRESNIESLMSEFTFKSKDKYKNFYTHSLMKDYMFSLQEYYETFCKCREFFMQIFYKKNRRIYAIEFEEIYEIEFQQIYEIEFNLLNNKIIFFKLEHKNNL